MNLRAILLGATALAGMGLLTGLAVLFLGSPDQAARVPSSGLLAAAVTVLGGVIYLQASKPGARPDRKSQSPLTTVAFGILVVIALFLVGFFVTHH